MPFFIIFFDENSLSAKYILGNFLLKRVKQLVIRRVANLLSMMGVVVGTLQEAEDGAVVVNALTRRVESNR